MMLARATYGAGPTNGSRLDHEHWAAQATSILYFPHSYRTRCFLCQRLRPTAGHEELPPKPFVWGSPSHAFWVVGYPVPPSRKRRIFMAARKHCKTPILELFSTGEPELVQQSHTYAHHARVPEDFLAAVHCILGYS
jgi:hypothetical protein